MKSNASMSDRRTGLGGSNPIRNTKDKGVIKMEQDSKKNHVLVSRLLVSTVYLDLLISMAKSIREFKHFLIVTFGNNVHPSVEEVTEELMKL